MSLTRWGVVFCALCVSGCATSFAYRVAPPPSQVPGGSIVYMEKAPPVAQSAFQCGPASLESVMRYWGREAPASSIALQLYKPGSRGVFNFSLSQYARDAGFWTQVVETDADGLKAWMRKGFPLIVMLQTGVLWVSNYHFVVLKGFNDVDQIFYVNFGRPETHAIRYAVFEKRWKEAGRWALLVCPPERVDWDLGESQASELGFLSERLGRLDLAEKWYARALDQNPKNSLTRFNLANVHLKAKNWARAKTVYAELLREKPDWGPVSNNLAWIQLQEGHPREAADVIEAAFKNGAERRFDILDTLGLAYCRLKDEDRARGCFMEAIQKIPEQDAGALPLIRRHLAECVPPLKSKP